MQMIYFDDILKYKVIKKLKEKFKKLEKIRLITK